MAIKNLFARGIGFAEGVVSWVVTRGFTPGAAAAPRIYAKSPTGVSAGSASTHTSVAGSSTHTSVRDP